MSSRAEGEIVLADNPKLHKRGNCKTPYCRGLRDGTIEGFAITSIKNRIFDIRL